MKLRYISTLLSMVISLIILNGCGDTFDGEYETTDSDGYLIVKGKTEISAYTYGGSERINIECHNCKWDFAEIPEWVEMSQEKGDSDASVTLTIKANTTDVDGRKATFYLFWYDLHSASSHLNTIIFTVTQAGAKPTVSTSASSFTYSYRAQNVSIPVTSNCRWEAESDSEWAVPRPSDEYKSLNIELSETPSSTNYRSATIRFSYNGTYCTSISITQEGPSITVNPTSLSFPGRMSEATIDVTSATPWVAVTENGWLTLTTDRENGKITVKASENETASYRNGSVVVSYGDLKRTVSVSQRAKSVTVSTSYVTLTASGTEASLTVEADYPWRASSSAQWLNISPSEGEIGRHTVTLTAPQNSGNSRSTTLYIYNALTDKQTASVYVTQY